MRGCYDCLTADRRWFRRYMLTWLWLGVLTGLTFGFLPAPFDIWAQGATFVALFAQAIRPVFAARTFGELRSRARAKEVGAA